MILTSNRGFGEWGEVFGDPVVATALLDRLLHHAVVIQIEGSHMCTYRAITGTYNPAEPTGTTGTSTLTSKSMARRLCSTASRMRGVSTSASPLILRSTWTCRWCRSALQDCT